MDQSGLAEKSYSYDLAYDEARRPQRLGKTLMPQSPIVDRILGVLYVPYFIGISPIVLCHFLALKASRQSTARNVSVTQGSRTASLVMIARCVYTRFGFGSDILAPDLLNTDAAQSSPAFRAVTRLAVSLCTIGFRLFSRDVLSDFMALRLGSDLAWDVNTSMHCRTSWLDDVLETFVSRNTGKPLQIIFLGAGFDTRCYRMRALTSNKRIKLFEVDGGATQAVKLASLDQAGISRDGVTYVTADFTVEDGWGKALESAGCDSSVLTCIVLEGVTMYLSREDVLDTLCLLRRRFCAGSIVAFDYLSSAYVHKPIIQQASGSIGEPLDFSLDPPVEVQDSAVQHLLKGTGLRLREHLDVAEVEHRYLPKKADGQILGHITKELVGGFVVAERC